MREIVEPGAFPRGRDDSMRNLRTSQQSVLQQIGELTEAMARTQALLEESQRQSKRCAGNWLNSKPNVAGRAEAGLRT